MEKLENMFKKHKLLACITIGISFMLGMLFGIAGPIFLMFHKHFILGMIMMFVEFGAILGLCIYDDGWYNELF